MRICSFLLALAIPTLGLAFTRDDILSSQYDKQDDRGLTKLGLMQIKKRSIGIPVKKINALLYKILIKDRLCDIDPPKKKQMWSNSHVEIDVISNHLLGFTVNMDSYCGGPYPDAASLFYMIDLKQGRVLDFTKSLNNQKAFKQYLAKTFHQQIPKNVSEDCLSLYSLDELQRSYYSYGLAKGSIKVRLDYPHVSRACEYEIKLACQDLVSFVKPKSPIARFCFY